DRHDLFPVDGNTVHLAAFRPPLGFTPFLFRGVVRAGRRWLGRLSRGATRRSARPTSSRVSSRLTRSRARSSAMLFRSRSASMSSLAPGEGDCAYQKLLCSLSSTVATCLGVCCHAQIIEEIRHACSSSGAGGQK